MHALPTGPRCRDFQTVHHAQSVNRDDPRLPDLGPLDLILATVMSRIDYCNSALAGLPQSTLPPLQRVQNAAARLVFELGAREHVTPSLL